MYLNFARRPSAQVTVLVSAVIFCILLDAADTLTCHCTDCPGEATHCSGDICTAQVNLSPTSSEVVRRWRCLNSSSAAICNTTSPLHTLLCCDVGDWCNDPTSFWPQLNTTNASGDETSGEDGLTVPSTNTTVDVNSSDTTVNSSDTIVNSTESTEDPSNSTTKPTTNATSVPTINTTTVPTTNTTTAPPTVPITQPNYPSTVECFSSESSSPTLTSTTLCLGSSCYLSLRLKSDGSRQYRRGCTTPLSHCEEENRRRKKKFCCDTPFCNHEIPDSWGDDDDDTTQETTPPMSETPPTDPPTRPPPAVLSTLPTSEEFMDNENCTMATDDTITLSPCVGPGSIPSNASPPITDVPTPAFTGPVIIPEGGEPIVPTYIQCYCSDCRDSYTCQSVLGCAARYTYDAQLDQISIIRMCIPDINFRNTSCGYSLGVAQTTCCVADMCNSPPFNVPRPTDPDDVGTEITVEPITGETFGTVAGTTVTEVTVAVETSTDEPTDAGYESESKPSNQTSEEDHLMLYIMTAVLGILLVILATVVMVSCIYCFGYRKKALKGKPHPPQDKCSRRGVTMVTRRSPCLHDNSWDTTSTPASTPESTTEVIA